MQEKRLVNEVINTIRRFNLLSGGEKVLVAVSGGPDSIFLLHMLMKIAPLFRLSLAVAHFNHGLREEADDEQRFVGSLCEELGLEFFHGKGDVAETATREGIGIEEAARKLRYGFLQDTLREWGGDRVALGHTRDDTVETILFNLFRGTGLAGAAGIPPRRSVFIRPIITISKAEILNWLDSNGIPYMIDRSNLDTRFTRNYLRHKVIPVIKNRFPGFDRRVSEFGFILREQVEFLEASGCRAVETLKKPSPADEIILDRHKMLEYHRSHRFWIYQCLRLGFEMSYAKFSGMEDVLVNGGRLHLGGGWKMEASESDVRFFRAEKGFERTLEFTPGETLVIDELNMEISAEYTPVGEECQGRFVACFPKDGVEPPFTLRSRRPGDRIKLKAGWRSLKRLFIDLKVPRWRRELIPVILDRKGILWVVGFAKTFRGKTGENALKMEVKKHNEREFWIYD